MSMLWNSIFFVLRTENILCCSLEIYKESYTSVRLTYSNTLGLPLLPLMYILMAISSPGGVRLLSCIDTNTIRYDNESLAVGKLEQDS